VSILDHFEPYMVAVAIERITTANVNGVPTTTTTPIVTTECLYWEGAAAQALVSDRFRDRTAAVIGMDVGADVRENDIAHVEGVNYHVLFPDNIGAADEVLIVALEVINES